MATALPARRTSSRYRKQKPPEEMWEPSEHGSFPGKDVVTSACHQALSQLVRWIGEQPTVVFWLLCSRCHCQVVTLWHSAVGLTLVGTLAAGTLLARNSHVEARWMLQAPGANTRAAHRPFSPARCILSCDSRVALPTSVCVGGWKAGDIWESAGLPAGPSSGSQVF